MSHFGCISGASTDDRNAFCARHVSANGLPLQDPGSAHNAYTCHHVNLTLPDLAANREVHDGNI